MCVVAPTAERVLGGEARRVCTTMRPRQLRPTHTPTLKLCLLRYVAGRTPRAEARPALGARYRALGDGRYHKRLIMERCEWDSPLNLLTALNLTLCHGLLYGVFRSSRQTSNRTLPAPSAYCACRLSVCPSVRTDGRYAGGGCGLYE